MGWVTGPVVYALIWWTVLFAVLPIGIRPQTRADAVSGWRGAPERPKLVRTALIVTLVSAVVWVGVWWVVQSPYLSFRHGWLALHGN